MKRLFVFDLDNTIYSYNLKRVPKTTMELILELSKNKNNYLAIATGRSPHLITIIDDIIHLFQFKIFINGALSFDNKKILHDRPIKKHLIKKVLKEANKINVPVGFLSSDNEFISFVNDDVLNGVRGVDRSEINVNPKAYKKNKIYQLWLFTNDLEIKRKISSVSPKLQAYFWHQGGLDLVMSPNNKVIPIKIMNKKYHFDQVICVGDGQNDIKMIEYADIGIAMGNSGFNKLKEKADLIAPNIEDDQLYNFFVENKLI